MADTTMTPPIRFATVTTAGLALSYAVDADAMQTRFTELWDPMSLATIIELGGGGTRTIRKSNVDHLGGTLPSPLSNETDQAALISRIVGYFDVTTTSFGFGVSDTYTQQIYGADNIVSGLSPRELLAQAPMAAMTLARYLIAAQLPSISTRVGNVATRLSVDNIISLQASFNALRPTQARTGRPVLWLHDYQDNQLRESIRIEPSFVQNGIAMALQAVRDSEVQPNFAGLGFDVVISDRVVSSGGGRRSGAYDRGGVALGIGRTNRVNPPTNGAGFLAAGMLGLIIQEVMSARENRSERWDAYFEMGAALADDAVFRQIGVDSIDAA